MSVYRYLSCKKREVGLEDLIEEIVVLSNKNHSHSAEDATQDYKNNE